MAALAAPSISGTPQSVVINAQNSSVEEILAGLSHEFKLQYRSSADLEHKVTGSYQGSLRQVLSRILKGYNFVLGTGPTGLEVTVLGTQGGSGPHGATVAAKPPAKPSAHPPVAAAASPKTPAGAAAPAAQKKPAGPVPVPETRVAEGGPPVPKPAAAGTSYPVPMANTKNLQPPPMPVASAASAPMPVASAGSGGPVPQFLPSSAGPPTPGAGAAGGAPSPLPSGKSSTPD